MKLIQINHYKINSYKSTVFWMIDWEWHLKEKKIRHKTLKKVIIPLMSYRSKFHHRFFGQSRITCFETHLINNNNDDDHHHNNNDNVKLMQINSYKINSYKMNYYKSTIFWMIDWEWHLKEKKIRHKTVKKK
jgi:hypothetical protein